MRTCRTTGWLMLLIAAIAMGYGLPAHADAERGESVAEQDASMPSFDAPKVAVTLIADRDAIVPGGKFRIGVVVDIEPGWHIYWRNPGDSGQATSITLDLPEGFVAPERFGTGALRWPVPQRFEEPGGMVTYGYAGRAVWMIEVRAPESLAEQDAVTIGVTVGYLACKELCIPGEAEAALPLRVADASIRTADAATLEQTVYPEAVTAEDGRFVVGDRVELMPQMVRDDETARGAVKIELRWGDAGPPTDIAFFPDSDPAYTSQPATIRTADAVTTIHMPLAMLRGVDVINPWQRHVVAWTEADGSKRAIVVPLLMTLQGPDAGALTDDVDEETK